MNHSNWIIPKNAKSTTLAGLLIIALQMFSVATVKAEDESKFHSSYSNMKLTEQLCIAIEEDKVAKFRKLIKDARVRISEVYEHLSCEGTALVQFANVKQSEKVENYLLTRVKA